MLSFKKISVDDKDIITVFTSAGTYFNCDFAFANMCSWSFLYKSEYAIHGGFLFLRFYINDNGHRHLAYTFPVGNGDLNLAVNAIENDSESMGHPPLILGVTAESKNMLNNIFPNSFTFIAERDYFDYIYLREDLISLKGKKLQSKRNHINKFKKTYEYTYLPITQDITVECMQLENIWREANRDSKDKETISNEYQSMAFAMEHFDELGLVGGAIVVDGKIVAFTYGSPINNKTFGVHVEKADTNYEGIFSVINQEFALRIPEQYVYINREEDLGIAGLRKSKLSYNPVILLEKYSAVKRR